MTRTARCACGSATITVEGDPEMYGLCHCANCKQRTGSAFGMSSYFRREAEISRSGDFSVYAFHHAAADHDQARHFCARCGTTLLWFISSMPDHIGIAAGCFGEEALGEPK